MNINYGKVKIKRDRLPTMQAGNKKILDSDHKVILCWSIAAQWLLNDMLEKHVADLIPEFASINNTVCHNCKTCIKACYDIKAYRYRSVVESRLSNLIQSLQPEFKSLIQKRIESGKRKAEKNRKKLVIRLHVAGDFYNGEYLQTWIEVIKNNPNVTFYGYTKNFQAFEGVELPSNLNILFSLFDDMDVDLIKLIVDSGKNVFYATNMGKHLHLFENAIVTTCNGFDCMNCKKCETKTRKRLVITTPIH